MSTKNIWGACTLPAPFATVEDSILVRDEVSIISPVL